MIKALGYFLFYAIISSSCTHKQVNPDDPKSVFQDAKEPYDDGNLELAREKLGKFKTRFPYSKYVAEAELLIAHSYFQDQQYLEANIAYRQFLRLHPKHPKAAFITFRIGESLWLESPEEIDRDQRYTKKAIEAWQDLLDQFPNSSEAKEARKKIQTGQKRLAKAYEFAANFYYKKEIWHACAYRYLLLLEKFPNEISDKKQLLDKTSFALEKLAKQKKDNKDVSNLYFKNLTPEEILEKAKKLKVLANKST